MPNTLVQTFTLLPHPTTQGPEVAGLTGRVTRIPGGLQLSYLLQGDLPRLRVPPKGPTRFADELWRHTCFELFVSHRGEGNYHEFNFSPSGEWAVYAFARYRERIPLDGGVELATIDPGVKVRRSEGELHLEALVHLNRLSPRGAHGPLLIGLSAVIEGIDGSLSYWALKHAGAKPDFHHRDAFVLELDEIRN